MVKKVKHFRYDINRKNLNKAKKKQIKVPDEVLKVNWDHLKSTQHNMKNMGLLLDSNKIVSLDGQRNDCNETTEIVKVLQAKSKMTGPKKEIVLSEPDRKLCIHFLSTYGEDIKKMVKDDENIYQLSVGQIGQLLKKFKMTKHYNEYLTSLSV